MRLAVAEVPWQAGRAGSPLSRMNELANSSRMRNLERGLPTSRWRRRPSALRLQSHRWVTDLVVEASVFDVFWLTTLAAYVGHLHYAICCGFSILPREPDSVSN